MKWGFSKKKSVAERRQSTKGKSTTAFLFLVKITGGMMESISERRIEMSKNKRAMIFVDDPQNAYLRKTAEEKFDEWIKCDRNGVYANIVDVRITAIEGLPTRIVVLYTLKD
jgi:hypothetical protein